MFRKIISLNVMLENPIVVSILINLFFLGLCLSLGVLRYGALDDYFMSSILTGAYGKDYNVHMYFVNALYGYILLPLYHLFPKVGWYYIGEMLSVYISFCVICYVIIKKIGLKWGTAIALFFVACFASDFYLAVQFTQCAAILSAAGMLAITYAVSENSPKYVCFMVLGSVLIFWGSLMRWDAFLMGIPFVALALLLLIKNCWKQKRSLIVTIVLTIVAVFAAHQWDKSLYTTDEYHDYGEIQGPRSFLMDGANYDKNAAYEDFEELGESGIDFHFATTWIFYDTEFFCVQNMKRIISIASRYMDRINLQSLPLRLLASLSNTVQKPMFWAWLILCLFLIVPRSNGWRSISYPWMSLFLLCCLMGYLLGIGRLVYRVQTGIFLYACCMAVPFMQRIEKTFSRKIMYLVLGVIVVANVFTYATTGTVVRDCQGGNERDFATEDSVDYASVHRYIKENKDKMFLLSMHDYMTLGAHGTKPYVAEPMGAWRNMVSLGYWTPYLPDITDALQEYGVENPMKDAVHDNVIVVGESQLGRYMQRHYYDSVAVDTVETFGEMIFYKYRLVEVNND